MNSIAIRPKMMSAEAASKAWKGKMAPSIESTRMVSIKPKATKNVPVSRRESARCN